MPRLLPKRGLNRDAHLVRSLFDTASLSHAPTRDGFGTGLVKAGEKDERITVLCADLSESTRTLPFKEAHPDRFVQIGVSEQCMPSIAAGMAMAGKVPFVASYAAFSPGRNWEQIRTTVALNDVDVKIAGAHAGVSVGPDGATHQMLEDIALMRAMPNMRVLVPCDRTETEKATLALAASEGPGYIRFAREKSPVFTTAKTPFRIGRAEVFRFGDDATIIGAGPLLYEALVAAETLAQEHGLQARVIDCHTVKPLDAKTIAAAAKETGAMVTVEEAQITGGLGGAVCELLAETHPTPVERVGMRDRYGESGEPPQLLEGFGLTAPFIVQAVLRAVARKRGERVPIEPKHAADAHAHLEAMKKTVMKEALARTPRKWGGKQPDASLASRRKS